MNTAEVQNSGNLNTMKYAIEDSFPIVEINRLAVPERNAFKPLKQPYLIIIHTNAEGHPVSPGVR